MNKKILLSVSVLLIFTSQTVFAGPFDFINQLQKKEETSLPAVDLEGMSANGVALVLLVGRATISFSEAAVSMLSAAGNKESAEKLRASLEEIKKKPNDPEAIKKFVETDAKKATNELNKIKFESGNKLDLSAEDLVKAFMQISVAGLLDVKAVEQSGVLIQDAQNVLGLVQKDPLRYGFGAIGTVNSVIGSGKFIADNVPEQGKNIQSFADRLGKYLQANKIPLPSLEKLQKAATEMEKG